jgi:hypothetical protein
MFSAGMMVDDRICVQETIEHEGEVLVVVLWYSNPKLGLRRPEYVIRLTSLKYQVNDSDPKFPYRYLVDGVFPKSLFDGTATQEERLRFHVRKGPNITFPLETTKH